MKVSKAMHFGVITVSPETRLTRVAKLMADRRTHCVVVATAPIKAGSVWGIVTDLDLMAAASVRHVEDQCAAGSASTPAVLISPHARLTDAVELMTRQALRTSLSPKRAVQSECFRRSTLPWRSRIPYPIRTRTAASSSDRAHHSLDVMQRFGAPRLHHLCSGCSMSRCTSW